MSASPPAPLVTIVVGTRDRHALLERALRSVLAQVDVPAGSIEIVVVDDAGAHPPTELVEALRRDLPPVVADLRLIVHERNAGRSATRNTGIAAARGEWIGILDDDDLLHPGHVATLLDAAGGEPNVIAFARAEQVIESPQLVELQRSEHDDGGEFREDILQLRNLFPIQTALVPRVLLERVGGLDTELEVGEDWDLWLRLARHATYRRVDRVTSEYRHRLGADNSMTHERAHHALAIDVVYARHPLDGRADADTLEPLRARIARDTRLQVDASWRYERTVLAVLPADADGAATLALIERIATAQDALGGAWQLVLGAPRTTPVMDLLAAVEGDLVIWWYPATGEPPSEAELRRRATGRRVEHDTSLDPNHVPGAAR